MTLAGISVGNWLGGKLADRDPRPRTAGLLLMLGGASALAVLGLVMLLGDGSPVRPLPLLARIFLLTALVCLLPSLILGMVTPVVIKLLLPNVQRTGRVVGLTYALATLGSLVGNFLTGFVLVASFTVPAIVAGVGIALLLLGLLGCASRGGSPAADLDEPAPTRDTPVEPQAAEATAMAFPAGAWWHLPGNVRLAGAVVVVASFCTMTIELAASRALAPQVGVSLYSWTGIIGVVLAGITLGNYLGGRIADRWPRQQMLGLALYLGGLASLLIVATMGVVAGRGLLNDLGLMERIVAWTATVFFVPVLLLGTISPQVIRLAVTDLRQAGRVAGRVYAWSTVGAIAGTFATGWLLISLLGVYALILGTGLVLIALAIAAGGFWRRPLLLLILLAVAAAAVQGLNSRGWLASPCTLETDYYCIRVYDDTRDGGPVKTLVLDHLIHSFVRVGDPAYLGYEHEQVQAEVARLAASRSPRPRLLVIGGGGYTFPRWVDAFLPNAAVEVVEIDPGVTEVAHRELGMPRDTRIVTHNLDGRQFVHELASPASYQLVVQDAVNDLSVPYHILTREYNDDIRAALTDDGVYLLTVIDLYRDGQLLRSCLRTLMQTFPHVQLLAARPSWDSPGSSVFVIAGSQHGVDLEEMRQTLRGQGVEQMKTIAQPADQLRAYVGEGPQIVLTDQYAPVDNLISILFRSRN